MYSSTVLIVSKRKEISIKHKKALQTLNNNVFTVNTLDKMFEQIKEKEPELIMISDTMCDNFVEIIKQVKILTYNYSPIIIAVSRSSNLDDKLKILEHGADDCFGEEITSKELIARTNAHLRRYIENSLNPMTGLIGEKLGLKNIKRALEYGKNLSIILIEIQNSIEYREIYGEIAYGKVMQTIGALVNSTFNKDDFISHFSNDKFVLITHMEKAEKVASFLTFAFDNMIDKFYSKQDFENKFIKYFSDERLESKIPLMKLNIAIINLENERSTTEKEAIEHLNSILRMCRKNEFSTYIVDRIKLKGKTEKREEKNKVLIVEKDEALSYLLESTCKLNKLNSLVLNNTNDFEEVFSEFLPDTVVLDYEQNLSVEICKMIKQKTNNKTKIIFTSSEHKKDDILASGADLYLPKPYEINTLFKWITRFLKED